MDRSVPDISVVIPAFNEAARITEPLRRIDRYLRERRFAGELIVVDDGSTDGTVAVLRSLAGELFTPVSIIECSRNRGKGHAVRTGMTSASGRAVLMTDADLSTPIEQLDNLLPYLQDGAPIVIGSRKMAGAVIEVRQPFVREAMGRVFTALTRWLVVRVSDVTCGFKLFTAEAAIAVFGRASLDDWSFDAEALYIARRLGYRIVEVPVAWADAPGTKVHRILDALRALEGIARIRWNALRGHYDLGGAAVTSGDHREAR